MGRAVSRVCTWTWASESCWCDVGLLKTRWNVGLLKIRKQDRKSDNGMSWKWKMKDKSRSSERKLANKRKERKQKRNMKIGTSNTTARYFGPIHLLIQRCHSLKNTHKYALVSGMFLKDDTQPVSTYSLGVGGFSVLWNLNWVYILQTYSLALRFCQLSQAKQCWAGSVFRWKTTTEIPRC